MLDKRDQSLGTLTVEIQSPTTPFLIPKYMITLIYFPGLNDYLVKKGRGLLLR
jgi:hypothetical protein